MGANRKYWNWHHCALSHNFIFKYFLVVKVIVNLYILPSWSGQAWLFRGLLCLIMKSKLWHLKYYWPCKVNFSLTRNIFLAAHLFTRLIGVSGPLVFARLGTFFSQEMATHIFFLLKGVFCRNLQIQYVSQNNTFWFGMRTPFFDRCIWQWVRKRRGTVKVVCLD